MLTITKEEWAIKKRHGYTSIVNGQRYILVMGTYGTESVPVKIMKERKSLLQALTDKDKKTEKAIDKAMKSGEIVRIF